MYTRAAIHYGQKGRNKKSSNKCNFLSSKMHALHFFMMSAFYLVYLVESSRDQYI